MGGVEALAGMLAQGLQIKLVPSTVCTLHEVHPVTEISDNGKQKSLPAYLRKHAGKLNAVP